jgi:peptidoglycan/LPS O-acetylase OafA/YrhL
MATIASLQALRALAAISVAITHFSQVGLILAGHPDDPIPLYQLASGVDLFFVISGFVMVYSSERLFAAPGAAWEFLARRIARIVPLYWLATAAAVVILQPAVDWRNALKSLLFIPYMDASGLHPLYGVGWTLNYEMFFYALFALSLFWRRDLAVPALAAVLFGLAVAGRILHPTYVPLLVWSDPIILEFVFGMLIALGLRHGVRLPSTLCLWMLAVAAAALWLSTQQMPPSGARVVYWGVPAAMIVAATVLGERAEDCGPLASFATLLGDGSYSIYLVHSLVAGLILRNWQFGLNQNPMMAVLAIGLIVTIVLSIMMFQYFERPATRAVRHILTSRVWNVRFAVARGGAAEGKTGEAEGAGVAGTAY